MIIDIYCDNNKKNGNCTIKTAVTDHRILGRFNDMTAIIKFWTLSCNHVVKNA